MRRHWNNKGKIIFRSGLFALSSLLLALCLILPDMAGSGPYLDSQHGDTTYGVTRSTIDTKYSTFSKGNCAHCHEQHASLDGAEPIPYTDTAEYGHAGPDLAELFSYEEGVCEMCHDGSPVPRDVKTQRLKTYHHPIAEYSGRHTMSRIEYGQSGAPFRGANRHAECADCHEPHYIGDPGTTYHTYNATTPANNNLVSNPIKGVWGVEPTTSPLWSPPTTYTELTTVAVGSSKEYQICYKCHSYYAFQDSDGITGITGPSGTLITDQAMEFSPGNKSAHPVQVTLSNQTGSPMPRALKTAQMGSPWTNVGNQTMWCCDCHGNDATSPVGPHGSNKKFMLKNYAGTTTMHYWPASSTGKLFSLNDLSGSDSSGEGLNTTWRSELFCLNCHPIGAETTGNISTWYNNAHKNHKGRDYQPNNVTKRNVYCIACHTVIPHGMKRSRLIVYDNRNTKYGTDVEPYRYVSGGVTYSALSGFKKPTTSPSADNYNKDYCWSTVSGCTTHGDKTGYEN